MKTEIIQKSTFQPVTIAITFESKAELDALGSLLNSNQVVDGIKAVFGVTLRLWEPLSAAGADITRNSEVISSIKTR